MGLGVGLFGVRENGGGAVSLQKKASVFGADDTEFSRCFIAITEIFFQTTWSTTAVGGYRRKSGGISHQETMERVEGSMGHMVDEVAK